MYMEIPGDDSLKLPEEYPPEPLFEERPEQTSAIAEMLEKLKTHRVVFLYAPTGSGKSLINLKVAMHRGSGYITTPQTTLVDQYNADLNGKFTGLGSAVMGRKNYHCPYRHSLMEANDLRVPLKLSLIKGFNSKSPALRRLSLSAARAPCISASPSFIGNLPDLLQAAREKRELKRAFRGQDIESPEIKPSLIKACPFVDGCPYYSARNKAMEDTVAVTTFHYFEYGILNGIRRKLLPEKMEKKEEYEGKEEHNAIGTYEWQTPSVGNATPEWTKRGVLVIDEAHNLPDFLVNFFTVSASSKWPRFDFFNFMMMVDGAKGAHPEDISTSTFQVFSKWFSEYYKQEEKRLALLDEAVKKFQIQAMIRGGSENPIVGVRESKCGPDGSVENDDETLFTQEEICEEVEKQAAFLYELGFTKDTLESGVEWIYSPSRLPSSSPSPSDALTEDGVPGHGGGDLAVSWKPYEASPLLESLWSLFPKIVFSSATFLDIPTFLKRLGLDPEDASVVDVPSTFRPDSSPIYFPFPHYLSWKYMKPEGKDGLMAVVGEIERIAAKHPDTKGVVHFHSYEWFRSVYRNVSPATKNRVIVHDSGTRNEKLDEFKSSPRPMVLFAVSMGEGTDFRDDQARWQIIVKTPYQDLKDEWVARHRESEDMGQRWYDISALQMVIQAAGRIVRSRDDWGETYVLDRTALKLIKKYETECPDWFLERIVQP